MVRLTTAFLLSLPLALAAPSINPIEAIVNGPEDDAIVDIDRRPEALASAAASLASKAAARATSAFGDVKEHFSSVGDRIEGHFSSLGDHVASRTSQIAGIQTLAPIPIASLNSSVFDLLHTLPSASLTISVPYPTTTGTHGKNSTAWGNSTISSTTLSASKTSLIAPEKTETKENNSVFGKVGQGCWAENCTNSDSGMRYEQTVKVSSNKEVSGASRLGVGLVTMVIGAVAVIGLM